MNILFSPFSYYDLQDQAWDLCFSSSGFNFYEKRSQTEQVVLLHVVTKSFVYPHLSKGSSGCKQKCTQTLTIFLGTVINALSHGVIHFVWSVSFKNLEMDVYDWLLKNFNQRESGFSS